MTNQEHNKYLAWAFIGHGAFQLMITLLMVVFFAFVITLPDPGQAPPPMEFFFIIFGFMFVFQMIFVAPSFVAAYALLKRRGWARIASIVAGVVAAMNVPFGTLACVYSLWFFLGDNWKEIYHESPMAGEALRAELTEHRQSRWAGYHTDEKGEIVFHPVDPPDWRS